MARGPRNLRVAADGVGLTQFGGVALIEQFFQRIHLQGALWRHVRFAQRNNRYSISESLKALLYPLVLGLGRIETTEPLRYNGVFHYLAACRVIPKPPACGASSAGSRVRDAAPLCNCTTVGGQPCSNNQPERSSIWTARC